MSDDLFSSLYDSQVVEGAGNLDFLGDLGLGSDISTIKDPFLSTIMENDLERSDSVTIVAPPALSGSNNHEFEDLDAYLRDLPSPDQSEIRAELWAHQQKDLNMKREYHEERFTPDSTQPQLPKPKKTPAKKQHTLNLQERKDLLAYLRGPAQEGHQARGRGRPPTTPASLAQPPRELDPDRAPSRAMSISSRASSDSKQANYARMYRAKNKMFVDALQARLDSCTAENEDLKEETTELKSTVLDLKEEIMYLRSVLANDSALAPLIQGAANNVPGAKLKFGMSPKADNPAAESFPRGKRPAPDACRSPQKRARGTAEPAGVGVCLHVREGEVSVEFCGRCNKNSRCVPDLK